MKITLKKPFGELTFHYEKREQFGDAVGFVTSVDFDGKCIFECNKLLSYVLHEGKEYMGLALNEEEYTAFCKATNRAIADNKGFISLNSAERAEIECNLNKDKFKKELDLAKETNEAVTIIEDLISCTDPSEECNLDRLVITAHPDGTITHTITHTW